MVPFKTSVASLNPILNVYGVSNPLAPGLGKWIWKELSNLTYIHGAGGREGTRIRCTLEEDVDPSPQHPDKQVFMRVGKKLYKCFKPCKAEETILGWFKKLSMVLFGEVGLPNGLYINVGEIKRGQGYHSDWHILHGTRDKADKYRSHAGNRPPLPKEAHTLTLSLIERVTSETIPCIKWKENDIVVAELPITEEELLHIQPPESQSYHRTHGVEQIPHPDLDNLQKMVDETGDFGKIWRVTISARYFTNPSICLKCWWDRVSEEYIDPSTGNWKQEILGIRDDELTNTPFTSEKSNVEQEKETQPTGSNPTKKRSVLNSEGSTISHLPATAIY
jgi:hypothetical protein